MDVVICYCLKCKSELGRFRNAWNGIGNTYFSPVHNFISGAGFEKTGDVYEAARGSSIEFSLLRDLVCAKCRVVLGLCCDSAPDDHILKKGQLILRLKETTVISEGSGKIANVSVLKVIPLKDEKNTKTSHSSVRPDIPFTNPSNHQYPDINDRGSEQREIQRLPQLRQSIQVDTTSELKDFTAGVEKFREWVEETIFSQQKDIDRLSGTVLRVEKDMQTLKKFMKEVSSNFATNLHFKEHKKELAEVREQINGLHERLDQYEVTPEWNQTASLLARNMKTIAGDVKKFSNQVKQFDGLKLNLQDLTNRLDCLEDQDNTLVNEESPCTEEILDEIPSRKRTFVHVEKNFLDQEERFHPTQQKVKKRRSHDSGSDLGAKSNSHAQEPDIIDLVSPEPDCNPEFDTKIDKKDVQYKIPTLKKGIPHQTPQVLIFGSNSTKVSHLEPKKKTDMPRLENMKVVQLDYQPLKLNNTAERESKWRKSGSTFQNSALKPYPSSSNGNVSSATSVDLDDHTKIDRRHLRNRRLKTLKD